MHQGRDRSAARPCQGPSGKRQAIGALQQDMKWGLGNQFDL